MSIIKKREITTELKESYLDYAMSVIISRALPDARDGLKPVHRRVLWAMWESGVTSSAKFRKSANTVGYVMGRYHPHGDTAIYDTLVRMAQEFSLRYPLVEGQGNFGSIDGDNPAAMRYTEARLSKIAEEMLLDIEKETVDWTLNYDAVHNEPRVLPGKLPNLLLNGTMGIAVGMATNIPPHNLGEVADAILYFTENPNAESEDLLRFVKGPDFPTGGVIFDKNAIKDAYSSGKGSITVRAKTEVVERKKGQHARLKDGSRSGGYDIVVTEIPYQVNKADLLQQIAGLVQNKKIEGIRDLRDESDREGLRVVVELKNDAPPQKVLNQLFKHTYLQKDFHLNMLALVNAIEPQVLSLRDFIEEYVVYRKEVIRRRTAFELKKAEERAHILEGLSRALHAIDRVIAVIKKSKDRDDARANLIRQFKLTEIQASAILDMRLSTLAALERENIDAELKEKDALIKELQLVLKTPKRITSILVNEVKALKEKYGDPRRTQVVPTPIGAFKEEDLVPDEETMITLSSGGYIKRISPSSFSSQKRGGKGLIGSDVDEEDFLAHFAGARTHDEILFFTASGKVLQTKAYEIPQATRTAKGRAIHNFLELSPEERISALVPYNRKRDSGPHFLAMVTKNGLIKKTSLDDFTNIRRTGIVAISLKKNDALIGTKLSSGKDEIIITTAKGQAIRFKESQARSMGRSAAGVRAIRLRAGDTVSGFDVIKKGDKEQADGKLLVVMQRGFGKQTPLKEYKLQNRGGSGIKTANITSKTGPLIAGRIVTSEEEIFALSAKGQMIRTELKSVRTAGRATQGVRIMNVKTGDALAAIVVV